jgi:hypothetical protein
MLRVHSLKPGSPRFRCEEDASPGVRCTRRARWQVGEQEQGATIWHVRLLCDGHAEAARDAAKKGK